MFGFFNKDKATDPVCSMKVDKDSQYFMDYQENKYYFCSENCLKSFKENPKQYVSQEDLPSKECCH